MVDTNSTIFMSSQLFNQVCLFHFKAIYISLPLEAASSNSSEQWLKILRNTNLALQYYYILQDLVEYWDFFKTSLISKLRPMQSSQFDFLQQGSLNHFYNTTISNAI